MRIKSRQILSFIVLLIFVFPFIQKEIHSLAHAQDFHCTTKTERHYHKEQHFCLVCEYNILLGETSEDHVFKATLSICILNVISFYKESSFNIHAYSYLLRGPPVS